MSAREYARAFVATRLHDPTPRLWGRLTFNPKVWFEPFGSGLLPALILVLWAFLAGFLPPPVAYAKPAPVDPNYFRNRTRDTVVTSLAGPVANLVLAAIGGLVHPDGRHGRTLRWIALAFMLANLSLMLFHLHPDPGAGRGAHARAGPAATRRRGLSQRRPVPAADRARRAVPVRGAADRDRELARRTRSAGCSPAFPARRSSTVGREGRAIIGHRPGHLRPRPQRARADRLPPHRAAARGPLGRQRRERASACRTRGTSASTSSRTGTC